jgi:hypothetical protein
LTQAALGSVSLTAITARHFGEARAHLAVLLQAVAQPIESLGDRFSGRAGERFGAVVDFDARDLKNLTSISEEGETVLLELMNDSVTVRASGVFAKEVLKQLARGMRSNGVENER